jgi:DtxR family transcriptional regulator, Mn-dependent transcriptional regulator
MQSGRTCMHDPLDELLESVWMLDEAGKTPSRESILAGTHGDSSDEHIDRLVEHGFLTVDDDGVYALSERGRDRARDIIRRHRLAERLLVDVLNMRENSAIESDACCFEHFLSPEVTDHICTLLGHPKQCPHGFPIPQGDCCRRAQRQVETAVVPLTELGPGGNGRVVYISTTDHQRLDRLTALGLIPGRTVRVHQKDPMFVLLLDETQLALEKRLIEDVYVVRS